MNRHSAAGGSSRGDGGKRERILDAAVKIFADKGFYNAKVSDIARVAGVADGTIYLYFKSKDDLLISLFEDRMEEVNENLRAALAGGGTPVEKLVRGLTMHIELVQRNPLLAEVLTVELRQSTKFLKEYKQSKFGEFLKLLAEPVAEGQADGSLRGDIDPHVAARALFGALDELTLAWLLRPRATSKRKGAIELAAVANQLGMLFIDGLRSGTSVTSAAPPPAPSETTHKRRPS